MLQTEVREFNKHSPFVLVFTAFGDLDLLVPIPNPDGNVNKVHLEICVGLPQMHELLVECFWILALNLLLQIEVTNDLKVISRLLPAQ